MQCLYLVLTIVVIQETSELNPDISKYNDWIKDAEATVKRIKAKEKSQAEYEMNKDTYIHDKRETDTVSLNSMKAGVSNSVMASEKNLENEQNKGTKNTEAEYRIVMVRNGDCSEWNGKDVPSGWYDGDLNAKGIEEARNAGITLKNLGYSFDLVHTSTLISAQKTLDLILEELGQTNIPVYKTWRLNERHYGGVTGLNRNKTAKKYGEDLVLKWRRGYDIQRTVPYWNDVIVPQLKGGKKILIVAHGTSLRGIVKYLDGMSETDIESLNLPTGLPFVYEFDNNLKPIVSLKFLGDEETVANATAAVNLENWVL